MDPGVQWSVASWAGLAARLDLDRVGLAVAAGFDATVVLVVPALDRRWFLAGLAGSSVSAWMTATVASIVGRGEPAGSVAAAGAGAGAGAGRRFSHAGASSAGS
jgi:hypothetical protein